MKKFAFMFAFFAPQVVCQSAQASSMEASDINSSYTILREKIKQYFVDASPNSSGGQERSKISESYARYIHKYQRVSGVKKYSNSDLELLRRAAMEAYADTNKKYILKDYLLDVRELARRGMASETAYRDEVYAFVQARMFDRAQEVVAEHPEAHLSPVPKVSLAEGFNPDEPAILAWDKHAGKFVAENVDLRNYGLVIVGHPLCHFTLRAVLDISKDNELKAITKGALWIIPQDGRLEQAIISRWNTAHPGSSMAIVYRESKWRGFNYWGTPTFYFLKDGVVVHSVIGWPSKGNAEALKRSAGIR